MQKRWAVLLLAFIAVHYLLHIASAMPELVHGSPNSFARIYGRRGADFQLIDVPVSFLFSLIPYLLLFYFFPRYRFWSVGLSLAILPVIFLMSYGIESFHSLIRLKTFFSEHLFYDIIYSSLGMAFYFFRYSHFQELQRKEVIIQSRQAELSFLRSQINPHFLFNSLNNIYALVYERSPQSLEALSALSDLLRYIIYDTDEKVDLQKELDYIDKYISLQRLRFDHKIGINMHVTGDINEVQLPPLLLIPFVENAFKHGALSSDEDGISINVMAMHHRLLFHCTNLKGSHQRDAGGGIGLQNVRRRLELLYPGKHKLQIKEDNRFYTMQLEIVYE